MSASENKRGFRWLWARRVVQVAMLALFAVPPLVAGWGLLGLHEGGDSPVPVPGDLVFSGTLSAAHIGPVMTMDPFAVLQTTAAAKTFEVDWLLYALPVLLVYGLIRGRAFCGWVCPVNLLLEGVDALRRVLRIKVEETPVPRHAKLWIALAVLVLSALLSFPVFEAFSPVSAINKGIVLGSLAGLVTLVAVVVAELFWGHRVWCRALCPLGGFYEAIGRVGLVNVRMRHEACIHCSACREACLADPEILGPVLDGSDRMVRAGDCMACGACVDACPTQALSLTLGRVGRVQSPEVSRDEGAEALSPTE